MLGKKQEEALNFISRSAAEKGYPPTLREIASEADRSVSTIQWHLKKLEEQGYLNREKGAARSVSPSQKAAGIPIVGRIAAGGPSLVFKVVRNYR